MAAQPVAAEREEREILSTAVWAAAAPLVPMEAAAISPRATAGKRLEGRVVAIAGHFRSAAVLEQERGTVGLLAPFTMGCGALAYFGARFEPGWLPLGLWFVLLAAAAILLRTAPLARTVLLGVSLAVVGAALAKLEVSRAGTKVLGGEISTRLTGDVVDIDHLANGRIRLVIDVVKTERPTLRYQPDRVRVSTGSLPPGVVAGSRISGPVKLHPPSGPIRPGSYDFSFQSYFDGLGANGYFLARPVVMPESDVLHVRAWLDNIRNGLAARIRAAIAGPEGEIAAALIVGVRAGIPEHVNESLRRTGLAHILSISGLHMALVAAIAMGTIRSTLALFPGFAARHPTKKYAAAGALALISGYLSISGAEIAAQRSYFMLAIMLASVLVDRRALSMRNLSIAAAIVLVVTPHEIVGPSFQMSFAATAALVGAYAIWSSSRFAFFANHDPTERRSLTAKLARKAAALVAGTIMTALVAGIATSIFGAWHFQRVSPLSLIANLAVSPIVSLVVMPFAVLAAIAMPLGLDFFFLDVMGKGLSAMLVISNWLSERSPVDAVGSISGSAVLWFTLALVAATLPTTRLRWTAVLFAIVGAWSMLAPERPDLLISEDAQLVAVRGPGHLLMLNRRQPNSFTLEGWKRALSAEEVVAPKEAVPRRRSMGGPASSKAGQAGGQTGQARAGDIERLLSKVSKAGFLCGSGACLLEHATGAIIAVVPGPMIAGELCSVADLIVVQAPRAEPPCRNRRSKIIDGQSLARQGAAAISITTAGENEPPAFTIDYAITEPYRPWHSHRAFSRAARGKPPYVSLRATGPRKGQISKPE